MRLSAAQRAAIDAALDAAREALGADTALLMHAAAGMIAWRGQGDRELSERYAQARAIRDTDLADPLMGELLPTEDTRGGVMFRRHCPPLAARGRARRRPHDRGPRHRRADRARDRAAAVRRARLTASHTAPAERTPSAAANPGAVTSSPPSNGRRICGSWSASVRNARTAFR
jgi:hypothetical protein